MLKHLIPIVFAILLASRFGFSETGSVFHDGGPAFMTGISYNFEWEFMDQLSLLTGIRFGPISQIGKASTFGSAWTAELIVEPHYYFHSTDFKKDYASLFLNVGLVSVPYTNSIIELRNNVSFGVGVKYAYKWIGITWSVFESPMRIFIEPYVFYRMEFYLQQNMSFSGTPTHWIGVGLDLGIDIPIKKVFKGVVLEDDVETTNTNILSTQNNSHTTNFSTFNTTNTNVIDMTEISSTN